MKNSFQFLLCAMLLCLYSTGCKDHAHPGKKIFRYNQAEGISSLDPAFARNQAVMWAVHQLYNTLVEVDEQMNIKPSLAHSWSISEDRLSMTFNLRPDVYFHEDGCFSPGQKRKLVAADVVYSFNRLLDPSLASPGAWVFNSRVRKVKPFEALNDSIFVLHLAEPFQPLLGMLSMQYCSIVPREAVEAYGTDFRRHPVGTGPFRFTAWEEGQALVLARNPAYHESDSTGRKLPYLDGIKVSFYDSKATEFLQFRQKKLDFINDIDPSFKDEVLTKTGNLKAAWKDKINMRKHPYLNVEYLGFLADTNNVLLKNSPLRLLALRQAINYGIDRKKMILYLRNSIGTAAEAGFVPMGLPSFSDTAVRGYHYDPAKARKLLADAGLNKSNMPPIKLLTVPNYASLGSYIVNELQQLGINAVVETVQKSLLLDQTSKSQVVFFRGSWIADYPDAENYLGVFYSKYPAPPNYTRYSNPAFDALYEKALRETNDLTRYEIYRQMDKLLLRDAPVVPLWYDMILHLVQKNISGFRPNSLNMLELRNCWKD